MHDEVMVSLSDVDEMGTDMVSVTASFIMHHIDTAALRIAACRVVDKWRLLAGRVEQDPSGRSTYRVRVPLGPLPKHYRRVNFTEATQEEPINASFPPPSSVATILSPPPIRLFRHPNTPNSLAWFSSRSTILSIHVTHLPEYDCIGLTMPHGIFDGFGMGHIMHALTSEVHGREWTPFPLHDTSTNILSDQLAALRTKPLLADPLTRQNFLHGLEVDWAPCTLRNKLKFGASMAYEMVWTKAERRAVYLGKALLAQLVRDVRSSQAERPSTYDVLFAWFFKAAYSRETGRADSDTIMIRSVLDLRPFFANLKPAFRKYPHNAAIPFPVLQLTIAELRQCSVEDLAVQMRRKGAENRTMASIQIFFQWLAGIGGQAIPKRTNGRDAWDCSVQTIAHSDKCDLGSGEPLGLWHSLQPLMYDGVFLIYPLHGGMVLDTVMRRSRWDAVEVELDRLKSSYTEAASHALVSAKL